MNLESKVQNTQEHVFTFVNYLLTFNYKIEDFSQPLKQIKYIYIYS